MNHIHAPAPLRVGILWGPGSLAGTAATVVDTLEAIRALAHMHAPGAAPVQWHWCQGEGDGERAPTPVPGPWGGLHPADVLVLPGWMAHTGPQLRALCARHRGPVTDALAAHVANGGLVVAFFNGSALLSEAGLLSDREAALPWAFAPSITLQSPAALTWRRDKAWHRSGLLWTTASISDALAALLDLLAHTPLKALVLAASPVLQFDAERQLTAPASMETPTGRPMTAGALEQARHWLEQHWNHPYSLKETAQAAATSPRTLLRWFAQVHGESPQDYQHRLRVARAQGLLQTTYLTVDQIARQCGYGDAGSFRRIFLRITGMPPGAWRRSFKLRTTRKQWPGGAPTAPLG